MHAFVNDLERPIGTYLHGRRMYETMVFWETANAGADEPAVFRDYAEIWRATEKIVYSRTLRAVSSARTRIEREFDRDAVERLKRSSVSDMSIGGPSSPARPSARGWSTSAMCSCARSWWGAASAPYETRSARISGSSMNTGSETGSFTSTTA